MSETKKKTAECGREEKKTENYKYFAHKDCEYFPCHEGADPDNFNCLFCYCPLYTLGDKCGGNFRYSEKGTKICTGCLFPHIRSNYPKVIERYPEIKKLASENRDK